MTNTFLLDVPAIGPTSGTGIAGIAIGAAVGLAVGLVAGNAVKTSGMRWALAAGTTLVGIVVGVIVGSLL